MLAILCLGSSWLYAGATPNNDPNGNSPCDSSDPGDCSSSSGMPIYSFKSMLAGLSLRDTPLSYVPPIGSAIEFILYYNEKDGDQNAVVSGGNFGSQWTSNWLTFIQDDPNSIGNKVRRYVAGGGAQEYSGYQISTGKFTPQHGNAAVLVRLNSQAYELRKNDGSIERFAFAESKSSYPRKIYLTERIDPQGNTIHLSYDNLMRLDTITDAIGQISHFYYDNIDFPLAVTRMADPFGRNAQIEYDAQGRLSAITDVIGLRSSFIYQDASYFINTMTTPYGTTVFEKTQGQYGSSSASIQAIDPMGYIERTEYRHSAPGIGYSESQVPTGMGMLNNYLNYRNSFYWHKSAFAQACNRENNRTSCDYTQAQIKHFLHNEKGQTARALESIKKPLESRVWFNYVGQSNTIYTGTFGKPKQVGRVLDDGTTQCHQYKYNAQGNITVSIDPEGRETHYRYAENSIDLVQIQQKNGATFDTLQAITYNNQHLPLSITDAAGQTTNIRYNEFGQPTAVTNALGQTTTYQYDAQGYLIKIYNHASRVQQIFSYDNVGRIASATDSEGYTLRYQYDALNRLTSIRYPDNTEKTLVWNKLDLASITDREGKATTYEYDANRNLVQETDPLGHVLQYSYYPNGDLKTLTDKSGNTTTWVRDIQGRVMAKTYADYQGYKLRYDSAGRLIEKQDALDQRIVYRYNVANLLTEKRYEDTLNPTANVQFSYDAIYPRPSKVTDTLGETLYQYHQVGELGANQLKTIQGEQAWQNWRFNYDALGREVSQSVANASISQQYDALGRITSQNNILGQFSYQYLGDSQQVTQQKITDVPYQWLREYYGNSHDRQLKTVQYQQLETIQKHWPWPLNLVLPEPSPEIKIHSLLDYDFSYSAEGRLVERTTAAGEPSKAHNHLHFPILHWLFGMHYGHHTQPQTIDGTEQYSYDDNGRLTVVNKQRRATGDYYYDPMGNITDIEESGFAYQQHYNELNQAQTHEYDLNGNLINDGQFTYNWDAENRLIRIQNHETNAVSEFVYDAYSRRVSENMTEANGQAYTVNNLWCGETLCAQANAQGQVTQRYFSQGEWHNGQAYFYAQDQIGSVTAMIDTQGNVAGTALYSPYGKLLQSEGVQASIAYAGLYHHKENGLYLATYRGYNPFTARWLNRDPIEENGGLNLYEYVGGSPVNYVDIDGKHPLFAVGLGAVVGGLSSGITTYAITGDMKAARNSFFYGALGGAAAVGSFLAAPATLAGTASAIVFDTAINAAGYTIGVSDALDNKTECDE